MSDLEEEAYYDSDSSDNEEQHAQFLSSVSQLDSTQRVKPASRKEISTEVSEYNLQKGVTGKPLVQVKELAKALKHKAKHVAISKQLEKVTRKSRTLPKPLEKPAEERLKRIIGYENVKNQVQRWNAVVEKNSLKDHLTFPLNNTNMKLQDTSDFLNKFQTSTTLEDEIAKVLKQEKEPEKKNEILEFPLTLKEMMEKRKEMAHMRARLSYKEAKAQRQNKIKSKKYHRIMKHEKVRQQLKEFEALQKTDPAKALEKLEELDKNRALERASLRHRNTGQWAKNLTVKAKYDVESRKMLAEQLKMSREITKKAKSGDTSDEEESDTVNTKLQSSTPKNSAFPESNPWSLNVSKEVEDFVSDYKKYWSEKNKEIGNSQEKKEETKKETEVEGDAEIKATELQVSNVNSENDAVKPSESEEISKLENVAVELSNIKKQNKTSSDGKKKKKKNDLKKMVSPKTSKKPQPTEEINNSGFVSVRPTSGVWIITTVPKSPDSPQENKRKRKANDINGLFNELEETLVAKAAKKAKKISKRLKEKKRLKSKLNTKVRQSKHAKLKSTLRGKDLIERPDRDDGLLEGTTEENELVGSQSGISLSNNDNAEAPPEIDPKNFIQVKPKRLGSDFPDEINMDDAIDDDVIETQQKIIEEAFGDDNVVAEFEKLKNQEEEKNKIEISTSLPGWGSWGGTGIVPSKRKKKRFIQVKLPPRKDKTKADIIINENENPNIKSHLVNSIPHPFKNTEAFVASMRSPIGREWIPETTHHKLIQKPIETKLGTIIDPMDEEELVGGSKTPKSPYQGKKKVKHHS